MTNEMFNIISLDVGDARIGIAMANSIALIANPLNYINNNSDVIDQIKELIEINNAKLLIIGLPQTTQGQDTAQTVKIREFAERLKKDTSLEIKFSDESNTSQIAEKKLNKMGKKFDKGDIDSLSAALILQRFIEDNHNDLTNIILQLELNK